MWMKFLALLTVIGTSTLLYGCEYAMEVSVSGSAESLAIDLKRKGLFEKSAPRFGYVMLGYSKNGQWKNLWSIDSTPTNCGPPTSHFKYGEMLKGFQTDIPAQRLEDGIDYELSIGGCGEVGSAHFQLQDGRVVAAQPQK